MNLPPKCIMLAVSILSLAGTSLINGETMEKATLSSRSTKVAFERAMRMGLQKNEEYERKAKLKERLLETTARHRLDRIRREDALEMLDRTVVLEAFSRRQNVFISKRHGLWDWGRDGIPGWLLPVLRESGLIE